MSEIPAMSTTSKAPKTPKAQGQGTKDKPWQLTTPSGTSEFVALPPVLEALGLAEVEHNPRNNRMRALGNKR